VRKRGARAVAVVAAIDVFPEEPIPAMHRARQTPNTVLSAHCAGNIPEDCMGIGERVVDDLEMIPP
jgi:phosphoglycerate dehydrogenase-like enzyme